MNRIQLINPPMDKGYSHSLRTGTYPPLNLGVLASFIKKNVENCQVELFDGEIESLDTIKSKINASFVGISCNTLTYKTALEIAEIAYNKGSKIFLGGPYAGVLAEQILLNRPYIDCVIINDGEQAIKMILENQPYEIIPNLAYRKNGEIVKNSAEKTNISEMAVPDYCNLPLEKYFANHRERYGNFKPFHSSLAIYSMKGCKWRDKTNGGCVFCMIPHFGVTYKKPIHVWNEILYYHELYGVDSFWEVSDSFVDNNDWLKEFRDTKPIGLDVSLSIYGRANGINAEKAKLLKEIGVFEVFIGAESGDNQILRNTRKGITTNNTRRAIQALKDEGINVIVSFVLGLPGETKETLNKTISFAKELSNYSNIHETSTSILFPMPGSQVFESLMKVEGMKEKYSSDILDYEQLKRDWLKYFTKVSFNELEIALNEITNNFALNSTFSKPKEQVLSALDC